MYIRFVTSELDEWSGAEIGFFQPAIAVKYEKVPADDWIRTEITDQVDWFNEHLDAPEKLDRSAGLRGRVYGICWFRPEAVEAVSRARYMAWLLTEAGIPVLDLKRRDPGEIIWRDLMQVVAKPPRDLPRLFH
ncbi:MAG: hypothetical protein AB8B85_21515 [Paracoccaceae bacterium]